MNSPLLLALPGAGYVAAGGLYLARLGRGTTVRPHLLAGVVYASLLVHAGLLGLRIVQSPAAPLSGVLESAVLVSLLLVLSALVAARFWRSEAPTAVVLVVAGVGLIGVSQLLAFGRPAGVPVPQSAWLWIHVPLMLAAFVLYAMAASGAAMYLLVGRFLKHPPSLALLHNLPTLDSLERFSHRMAELGFPLLTAGLLTGMIWADSVWGHPLSGTPKQVTAVVTWLIYAAYFHARFAQGMRGRRCAWLLVAGFVVAVVGYVVGALGVDPHSFV